MVFCTCLPASHACNATRECDMCVPHKGKCQGGSTVLRRIAHRRRGEDTDDTRRPAFCRDNKLTLCTEDRLPSPATRLARPTNGRLPTTQHAHKLASKQLRNWPHPCCDVSHTDDGAKTPTTPAAWRVARVQPPCCDVSRMDDGAKTPTTPTA